MLGFLHSGMFYLVSLPRPVLTAQWCRTNWSVPSMSVFDSEIHLWMFTWECKRSSGWTVRYFDETHLSRLVSIVKGKNVACGLQQLQLKASCKYPMVGVGLYRREHAHHANVCTKYDWVCKHWRWFGLDRGCWNWGFCGIPEIWEQIPMRLEIAHMHHRRWSRCKK